jgi:hypothetical protein
MKKYTTSILLGIITTIGIAQEQPTKYLNTISKEALKINLDIVASNEMEGRETGSKGQKKAGNYLISQYKKAGISFLNLSSL